MPEVWIGMGDLEFLVGRDAAETICANLGGLRVYVPKCPDVSCRLGKVAGWRAMMQLCEAYGGEEITVPNRRRKDMKQTIIKGLERGWTVRRIAEESGATERYVRTVAKMLKRAPRQGSLLS